MPNELLSVAPFTDQNLINGLLNGLVPREDLARGWQARYLLGYLKDLDARSIIIETDYVDGDYLDDYAAYYARCFYSYERKCKRLHFFSIEITHTELIEAIKSPKGSNSIARIQSAYLGFVVARPLPSAIIGRTVLKTYPDDNGRRKYPCTRRYDANLLGLPLSVTSLAFQEQDTVLAACATVALWSCFQKTNELFETPRPTPAIITRAGNQFRHDGRPIPSRGLNVQQICDAISHVGLEPEVIEVGPKVPLASLIYAHARMGLPVLIGLEIEGTGFHAVTVTGYSLLPKLHLNRETGPQSNAIPMVGLRMNELYVHDDQVGPFAKMEVKPAATVPTPTSGQRVFPITFSGTWRDPQTSKHLQLYPFAIIVPVYHNIRVTFFDVQRWIARLDKVTTLALMQGSHREWDIYLTTTNTLKSDVDPSLGVSEEHCADIRIRQHPRFIWRATLRTGTVSLVDVLVDATDMDRSLPVYKIAWHQTSFRDRIRDLLKNTSLKPLLREALTQRFAERIEESTAPSS